jgi:hypothetical protein
MACMELAEGPDHVACGSQGIPAEESGGSRQGPAPWAVQEQALEQHVRDLEAAMERMCVQMLELNPTTEQQVGLWHWHAMGGAGLPFSIFRSVTAIAGLPEAGGAARGGEC